MSRTKPSEWDRLVLQLPCGFCGAKEGDWCLRRAWDTHEVTGYAVWLHSARDRLLRAARQEGWKSREHYLAHIVASLDDPNESPRQREHTRQWLKNFPTYHKESDCPLCALDE